MSNLEKSPVALTNLRVKGLLDHKEGNGSRPCIVGKLVDG